MAIAALTGWTSEQKHVVAASFLGWTLDAFDFFLLVFVLKDIAAEFGTQITDVTFAILLTLAMRPIGAYLFGRAADRWGRRPTLMVDVLLYSVIELASGFAPSLTALLVLRAIFGVAMGGEWGVGASLTMESIPSQARGFVSGLLQSGYPTGYFLASIVYGLLFQYIGWRGMFMVGVIPALLVFYIRRSVPESPSWKPATKRSNTLAIVKSHWQLGIYAVLLMTAFNFFSHGTQDLYPTFLQVQHGMSPHEVGLIAASTISAPSSAAFRLARCPKVSAGGAPSSSLPSFRSPCCRCGHFRPARSGSRLAHSSCKSWCRALGASSRSI
jgi:MFS transporter, SHS family, lactate transporter